MKQNNIERVKVDTVLLVDDAREFRELIAAILQANQITCITAGSVGEARMVLNSRHISLALVDWRLIEPDRVRTGAEVLLDCREADPSLPVLILSGVPRSDFDVKSDALLNGADGFIEKPITGPALVAHVKQWLKRVATTVSLPQREADIAPLDEYKNRVIKYTVELLNGRFSTAATKLGIHRQTVSAVVKRNSE